MNSKIKTFRKGWNIFTTVLVALVVITDSATDEKNKDSNANPQQKNKANVNIPWLTALMAKLGIQKPKANAPVNQPVNRQGYVPGQA